MISVLILTFNEEENIGACIRSMPWRSNVVVLDSGSTDRTADLARELGAVVITRPFTSYADQRNFGLAQEFEHDWIVSLDADERMTPELAREIEGAVSEASPDLAMLRVRRKDMLFGRWLRRSSGYPTWFPRIFRKGRVVVEREINEIYVASGGTRQLTHHIVHFPFKKGLDWWFDRHNRYSTMEARVLAEERLHPLSWTGVLSKDPGQRRAALKAIAYRLPGRPFLAFLYLYVVRMGFLDGMAGFRFACMRFAYEIMIDVKAADLKSRNSKARVDIEAP